MAVYSYLKITDNKNVADFCVECTSMKTPKARISCLRTQLFAWEDSPPGKGRWRDVWSYFLKDYSFYVVERRAFNSLAEARAHKQVVYDRYKSNLQKRI